MDTDKLHRVLRAGRLGHVRRSIPGNPGGPHGRKVRDRSCASEHGGPCRSPSHWLPSVWAWDRQRRPSVGQFHTIPRLSPAYDYTTGGEFMAPPVPYGHYAKDYVGDAQKARWPCIKGQLFGLCGGHGGLFNHGHGDGNGDGNGCSGPGCNGAFGHDGGSGCGEPGCFGGISCGILGHHKNGGSADCTTARPGYATTMSGPSAQAAPDAISPDGLRPDRLQRRRQALAFRWPFRFRPLRRPGLRLGLRSQPRKRQGSIRRRTGRLPVLRRQGLLALPRQAAADLARWSTASSPRWRPGFTNPR